MVTITYLVFLDHFETLRSDRSEKPEFDATRCEVTATGVIVEENPEYIKIVYWSEEYTDLIGKISLKNCRLESHDVIKSSILHRQDFEVKPFRPAKE